MTERVQVIIQAKDAASGVLRAISGQFGQMGSLVEDLASPTRNWSNITTDAASMVINGLKQAIEYTVNYADEVHNLSLASGQSMEASSRFIQVLDDYGMTAQDAMTATRALTKQGLAPSIDTLASLSDEYNKLSTAEQKNAFIMKNLGRGGMEWANLLSKGSAAIRDQAAAVKDANIVNEETYQRTQEYALALDQLTDAWNGVTLEIGSRAIPALTTYLDIWNAGWDMLNSIPDLFEKMGEAISGAGNAYQVFFGAIGAFRDWVGEIVSSDAPQWFKELVTGIHETGTAADGAQGPLQGLDEELQKLEKTASASRQAMLSNMMAIQSASESYASGEESRAKRLEEIKAEEVRLALELTKARSEELAAIQEENKAYDYQSALEGLQDKQHKGKLTRIEKRIEAMRDEHSEMEHEAKLTDITNGYLEDQASITAQILKLQEQEKDLATESEQAKTEQAKATNQLVYNMLQQKAAQDGIVSSDELQFLMEAAVNMKLVDAASANAAISASKTADTMWASFEKTADPAGPMSKTKDLMYDMVDLDGYVVNFKVNFSQEGSLLPPDFTGFPEPTSQPYYPPTNKNRAEGGPVYAGETYWVGERGIPELYTPKRDGFITPGNKVGGITINIHGGLITQETVDYLTQEITKVQTG